MTTLTNSDRRPLEGKVALISGSLSGIGAAIAKELSSRGAKVVINYPFPCEKEAAERVLSGVEGANKFVTVEADLSTLSGPRTLARAAVAEFGQIDILVNNAGVGALSVLDGHDDTEFEELWESVVNLNARGTLLLTRASLPYLSSNHSRIINICSTTSRNPDPDMSIYAGSKGMIESFTRCWARDLPRKYGCTVNAVAPGPVATEAMLNAPPQLRDRLMQGFDRVPVAPRMARPEEIAWTVATLCDEGADWLNGLYVPVAGGSTLC
jgi:3-oxoacyl-[acyl-carrier protein] reductase